MKMRSLEPRRKRWMSSSDRTSTIQRKSIFLRVEPCLRKDLRKHLASLRTLDALRLLLAEQAHLNTPT